MSPVAVNQMLTGKQPQLLATKILAPRGAAGLIERPRLLGMTAQLEEKQLVVIKAAAGFGKTSLALAWADDLRRNGNSVAWLELDPDDNEPTDFSSTWPMRCGAAAMASAKRPSARSPNFSS